MNKISRFLSTGVLAAATLAVGAVSGYGQAAPNPSCADLDGHNALYEKFLAVYNKKTLPELETAVATGKEYLEKYGMCDQPIKVKAADGTEKEEPGAFKVQIDFVKPQMASLEKAVVAERERGKLAPFFAQFDKGLGSGNVEEVVSAGKQILAVRPDDMNFALAMALLAAEKSTPANQFKYADDAINYSKMVASKVKGGWTFTRKYPQGPKKDSPYIGIGNYNRDNKDLLLAELNYTVAYQTFYGKKDMKTAVPLYYELSQISPGKEDSRIFGAIGDYYVAEGAPVGEEIAKLIQQGKAATDEKAKTDIENQVKAKIALFNGYLERAIDAYGRAHSFAKPGPYKDGLMKQIQVLYKRRTDKDTGVEGYIASMIAKPFPNPTTPVTPSADPEPAPTTTTTGAAPASTTAPASTSAAKPAVTKPMSTAAPAATKTSAAAKKGTRK